jgi:hypothetical protein
MRPDAGHDGVQVYLVGPFPVAPAMFQVATRRLGIGAAWQSACRPARLATFKQPTTGSEVHQFVTETSKAMSDLTSILSRLHQPSTSA